MRLYFNSINTDLIEHFSRLLSILTYIIMDVYGGHYIGNGSCANQAFRVNM